MSQTSSPGGGSLYPAGHQNHLLTDQTEALQEFKALCEKNGCYTPDTPNTPASHDDETLLRFLRARRFVPSDALQQFKATEEWRIEQNIDNWYETIDVDEYEHTRLLYTHWTGRRDKRGIPLYVFEIAGLDSKKMSAYDAKDGKPEPGQLSPKLRRLFATCEHMVNFVFPLCSAMTNRQYPDTPISQTANVIDITGVSIRQFWNFKSHLQDASVLATAHYPETLGRIFVIGAPVWFSTIWNWLKVWFDAGTTSKIVIVPQSEVKATLEEYIDVDDMPKRYGGNLDWQFGQDPNLDPKILEVVQTQNAIKTLPTGPIRWKPSEDGTQMEAHLLGTVQGKQRDELLAHVPTGTFSASTSKKAREVEAVE